MPRATKSPWLVARYAFDVTMRPSFPPVPQQAFFPPTTFRPQPPTPPFAFQIPVPGPSTSWSFLPPPASAVLATRPPLIVLSDPISGALSQPLNYDQLWLNNLLSHNIECSSPATQTDNDRQINSIVKIRNKLWRACNLREQLEASFEHMTKNKLIMTNEDWRVAEWKLEEMKKELDTILSRFRSPTALIDLKRKICKIQRHKKWQKKHVKRLQSVRDERQRRRETLHKDIDEWRAEWIAKEALKKQDETRKKEAAKTVQEAETNKNKHKELTKLLEKVQKLRDLRREKMKREGHFFPEEDNEFFNRVSALNDAFKLEEQRLDRATTEATETHLQQAIEREREREREPEGGEPLRDPAASYWRQAELDVRTLLAVRRQWDYFLTDERDLEASRIPPNWVEPSPPANWVWASALVRSDYAGDT